MSVYFLFNDKINIYIKGKMFANQIQNTECAKTKNIDR